MQREKQINKISTCNIVITSYELLKGILNYIKKELRI